MHKISFVPDTNVFILNMSILEHLVANDLPFYYTLCISRTVLHELDRLKIKNTAARIAIKFIEKHATSLKLEIEGMLDARRVDVEVERMHSIEENNNDDKIINFMFGLENPVMLTNDRMLHLKSQSFQIFSILLLNKTLQDFLRELSAAVHCSIPVPEVFETDANKLCEAIRMLIEKPVCKILKNHKDAAQAYKSRVSLEACLKYILSNYTLFRPHLAANATTVISEYIKAIATKNIETLNQRSQELSKLFSRDEQKKS
ncbi:hypothetical protein ENBRE01_1639 [Enteropsectra breve]|nr:hypothetical protein ENBRE01_1639 [Enteropsectra breve]